jgi:hypothetical protein
MSSIQLRRTRFYVRSQVIALNPSDGMVYGSLSSELESQAHRNCRRIVAAYVVLLRSVNSDALVQHLHTVVRQRVELGSSVHSIKKLSSLFVEIMRAVLKENPPANGAATELLNDLSKGLVTLTEAIVQHHWMQQQQGTAEDVIDARRSWHPPLKDAFRLTEAEKALLEAEFAQHGWPSEGEERVRAELERAVASGEPVASALLLSAGCLVDGRFKIVEFLADGFFKNGFVAVDLKNLQASCVLLAARGVLHAVCR